MARILVVEEQADTRTLMILVLQRAGYLARGAATSKRALELISEMQPDLVVVGLEPTLPHGWSLAKQIKARSHTLFLPVVAYTTQELDAAVLFRANLSGFSDILRKPFDLDRLLASIKAHLPQIPLQQRPDIHIPAV
jgi:DNA-binding response OmpR family regulator